MEPTAPDERSAALARAVAARGYSAPEIQLIEQEGPFANHYGSHIRLDVLDGIVQRSRSLRAMLSRVLTGDELADLCTAYPGQVDPDDFACAGFDGRNQPLWRHAPDVARRARERGQNPTAEIASTAPRHRIAAATSSGFTDLVQAEVQRFASSVGMDDED